MEKQKLPRGIHLVDGRYRLYLTRFGRPVRVFVTWELIRELGIEVPAGTRLAHPGIELAKKAQVKKQAEILDEQKTGAIIATAKVRIYDLFPLIEQDYLRTGKKTFSSVLTRWNLHLRDYFGNILVGKLTSDDISKYILSRQHEKAAGGTINRELAVISRMMSLGQQATPSLVRGIPHFPQVKESNPRSQFLEQCDYDKLRQCAHELWLAGLLCTYYTFGFRRAELLNLRVHQVNLYDGTINLPSGGTKNGKPRLVCMTQEVRGLITALIEGKPPDAYVFTREDGKQIKDFRRSWKAMFAEAGVSRRMLHDMRRSAVRNAIRRGIDRDTVKVMSGHITDHVFSAYNIQAVDDLRDAAKKIEEGAASLRAAQTDIETDTAQNGQSGAGKLVQ